jgi:hypothetical protein
MKRDVVVEDFAPPMLDNEEAIQEPEGQRRHGEEVKGDDRFSMVSEEREPALGRIASARPQPSKIPATVRSETSKPSFSSSPWIFGAPQSEFSAAMRRMRVRISSPTFGRPPRGRDRQRQYRRKPARRHAITVSGFTMTRTSDHRRHMLPQSGPEETVEAVQGRSGPFAFEHGNLLSQSEDFKRDIQATEEEHTQGAEDCGDEIEHESLL